MEIAGIPIQNEQILKYIQTYGDQIHSCMDEKCCYKYVVNDKDNQRVLHLLKYADELARRHNISGRDSNEEQKAKKIVNDIVSLIERLEKSTSTTEDDFNLLKPDFDNIWLNLDEQLGFNGGMWLIGVFTWADLYCSYYFQLWQRLDEKFTGSRYSPDRYPRLQGHHERVQKLPGIAEA